MLLCKVRLIGLNDSVVSPVFSALVKSVHYIV